MMMTQIWLQGRERNYVVSLCVVFLSCLYRSDGMTVGGSNPVANFRTSPLCALMRISCNLQRNNLCAAGERCSGIRPIPDLPENSTIRCEYVCKSRTPINAPTNTSIEPSSLLNQTDSGNASSATETTLPTALTSLSWKEDPTYCTGNFICENGGLCDAEFKANGTDEPRCECSQFWDGIFCQHPCSKPCMNNGFCKSITVSPGNQQQTCQCIKGFTGRECEQIDLRSTMREETDIWYIPVFGCFSVLLLIFITYFVLQKLKWRSLFVTKLFHFFQPYEDDDGKEFDAFISFRSSKKDYSQSEDEKFVLQVLQPMLEKEFQYKVCVHYRDFLPGETIANNIIWAVENSRRTILVLSPLYVESEWARMEYQKAQQEMLQLRHKIIPIIFEDIEDTPIVDPTLKHILASVTYIHYPKSSDEKEYSKFWQMVGMALPKRRSVEGETSSTDSHHPPLQNPTSQALMSQESWQSARTDVTDIEMDGIADIDDVIDIVSDQVTDCVTLDVNVDVNEADKLRNNKVIADPVLLNNNADKYLSILEGVS